MKNHVGKFFFSLNDVAHFVPGAWLAAVQYTWHSAFKCRSVLWVGDGFGSDEGVWKWGNNILGGGGRGLELAVAVAAVDLVSTSSV